MRRECSVDAVNEKPLGKSTEAKWVCVCKHVFCLGVVQVLKCSVTWSPCAVEIISIPMLSLNTGVYLPCVHESSQKKFAALTQSASNTWRAAMIDQLLSGPVHTFTWEKPWSSGCAVSPSAGWHPALASWSRAVEQEAKFACPQLKPHSLSQEMYPKWRGCVCCTWYRCGSPLRFYVFIPVFFFFLTMMKDNACTRRNYASLKQDFDCDFDWGYIMMMVSCHLVLLSSHPPRSISLPLCPSSLGQSRFIQGFSHVVNQTRPQWNCIDWEECM